MAGVSMSELTTYRWSFEEDVERYRQAGYDAIGVWRQKLSDCGEERGAELLRENGLRVSSLFWAGGFTGSDGRSFRDALDDAQEAIRVAALLKSPCVVVCAGGRAGHTRNHARRILRSALRELAPLAQAQQVALALEPMHPDCAGDFTFLTSVEETLEAIRELEFSSVKLALDLYHVGFDASLLAQLPHWIPHVALVQLGDGRHAPDEEPNRCRLGDGKIPLGPAVQTLIASGYAGDFEVELRGEDVEHFGYDELLEHSRRIALRLLAEPGRAAG